MSDIAFEALARGDAAAALAAARAAVASLPESAQAHHALGLALRLSGDIEAAVAALEQAIALAPERAALHLTRAGLAISQGDPTAADSAILAAVAANPNSLGAYLMAHDLALARGRLDEAQRQLRLAQRVAAEHPQVLAAEGALALAQGEHALALRRLSVASEQLPDDPRVLAALGLTHRAMGNHAFAEGALRRAIAIQPRAVALRWQLIDSLRQQDRAQDAREPLQELLAFRPQDRAALALLGDLLMRSGEVEAGLDAYRRLLLLPPLPLAQLDGLLLALLQIDEEARIAPLLDELLARYPDEPVLWQRRLRAANGDLAATEAVFVRWQQAQPDSPVMQAARAEFEEARGDLAAAVRHARASLDRDPTAFSAEGILLRSELLATPEDALARADRLLAGAAPGDWHRALHYWRGHALDRLGRPADAAAAWKAAWASTPGGDPLPKVIMDVGAFQPGSQEGPAPRLLWAPPGGRAREVLSMLARVPGFGILDDRFGDEPRADGFGPPRPDGAVTDRVGWRAMVAQRGVDPTHCIDWLPHWDRLIAAALPGAQLVAVIADPRDLLLNWLAYASHLPARFPGALAAAEWLDQALQPLLLQIEAADPDLLLIRDSELVEAPAAVAQRLQQALQLEALPDVAVLDRIRLGMGGLPQAFVPGHWRAYAGALALPFERLTASATRLGYPAA
jgi:tetratricopeptide (TPR) repeat protein